MAPRRFSFSADTCYPKLDLDELLSASFSNEDDSDGQEELLYANGTSVAGSDQKDKNGRIILQNARANRGIHTKEDEDVEMFLAIVEQMSVQSILFLLQDYAREMFNIPEQELKQALLVETHTKSGRHLFAGEFDLDHVRKIKPIKKFRFAEIMGGSQIRVQVREHLHISDISDDEKSLAWWTYEEMSRMKRNAAKVVRHYKQHRADFIELCEQLACEQVLDAPLEQDRHHAQLERQIKSFAKEGAPARGLETHICGLMGDLRYRSIQKTLDRQDFVYDKRLLKNTVPSDEEIHRDWESVREVYVQFNRPSVLMAEKIAHADHMQAFKAILSKWTVPTMDNDTSEATTTTAASHSRPRLATPP